MEIINFIKNYWSQIAILLGVIGYIIKLCLEYYIKAKEIKFTHTHSAIVNDAKKLYVSFDNFNFKLKSVFTIETSNYNNFADDLEACFKKLNEDLLNLKLVLKEDECTFLNECKEKMSGLFIITLISLMAFNYKIEIKEMGKGLDIIKLFYTNEFESGLTRN